MDRLDMMRLFVRVVETGSFSEAARIEGVAQPTASKSVAALETRLGARLLDRSSRAVSVTPAGQEFFASVSRVLNDLRETEARIARGSISPSGRIRVALASGLGRLCIIPRMPEFVARYPELSVDLDVASNCGEEVRPDVDVDIRVGLLVSGRLQARCIGSAPPAVVATPEYLARHGQPHRPDDLEHHQCIGWKIAGDPIAWNFTSPNGPLSILPAGGFRTNDAEQVRAAVLCGLGIGYGPAWLFADELEGGSVNALLSDYLPEPWPITAVCSRERQMPHRVRAFVDFLSEVFAGRDDLKLQ